MNNLLHLKTKIPLILSFCIIFNFLVSIVKSEQNFSTATGNLTKITIPERNKEGFLIWQLTGDHAKIRPDGKVEIEQLLIHTFRNSQVDWTFTTPLCLLNKISREAVSESDIRITNQGTEITGTGFYWLANESRFIIRSKVHVILPNGILKKSS